MKLSFDSLPIVLLAVSFPLFRPLEACDSCAVPVPVMEGPVGRAAAFYLGVEEQYTHFGTLRVDGNEIPNVAGQYMNSSIAHVALGLRLLDDRLALQVNLPFIARRFQRPEGFEIQRGTVAGFGDMSLLAGWNILRIGCACCEPGTATDAPAAALKFAPEPDFSASVNLLAGLKFPTGSPSLLQEEFDETEVAGAPESGIHGHDLALGSGSWDGVFGAEAFVRHKKLFFQGEVQYAARSEGSYSYRYANEIIWSGGPGIYLAREPGRSIALQAVIAGSSKGLDTFQGEPAADTSLTMMYVGPRVFASFDSWSMELACDLPVLTRNTALQVTPDFRIRAGVGWHF